MSKKSNARSAARGAAKAAGGAHLTCEARMGTLGRLMDHLHANGYQVAGVESLGERHIALYFQARLAAGRSKRTLQNEAAHIRGAMRAVGRAQAADSPSISNQALGLEGASRLGTKKRATDAQYRAATSVAMDIDSGIAACVALGRTLGLRAKEAVCSGPSLRSWEAQLLAGARITVVYGTKNGRLRDSAPADREAALAAVRFARTVARARRGYLLPGTLKQALNRYRNELHRKITPAAGVQSHALRYAYTHDRIAAYLAAGLSLREARAAASIDLGHGSGRGRYVASVYGRQALPAKNSQGAGLPKGS